MGVRTAHSVRDGQRFNADTTLVVVTCYSCHVKYAIPKSLDDAAQKWPGNKPRGWKIHCPFGHDWYYLGESWQEQVDAARNDAALARSETQQERARAEENERRRVAQKAATTRARKRHAAGVCPACKRTFKNVQRHMESQHPDYDPAVGHHEGT